MAPAGVTPRQLPASSASRWPPLAPAYGGWDNLDTLPAELANAKKELHGVIDEATARDYTVTGDGNPSPADAHAEQQVSEP